MSMYNDHATPCPSAPCTHQPRNARPAHDHCDGAHSHDGLHHHGGSERAIALALAITVTLLVLEVIGGLISGSLALLADAGHMLTDAAALGLSLGAAWLARRPVSQRRTFGWYRAEILAALINGVTLLVLVVSIVGEAIDRIRHPAPISSGPMLAIAVAGLLGNLVAAWILLRSGGENLNARGAYLHVLSDALGSVAAILAAVLIGAFGWYLADPLLSILTSVLITFSAWKLVRAAIDVLLEAAPPSVDVAAIQRSLSAEPLVADVHDLHVWSVSSDFVALSGHVRLRQEISGAEQQRLLQDLRRRLSSGFAIEHVTLQIEAPGAHDAPISRGSTG